ncbi:hypothetical protein NS228_16300 [Methylobacterium indicum]|uniref:DUF7831 domain-containing protein n=1 Tax=Methylobacterium indicum TaxID=1775910 RepID=UPI0007350515|nr:hypothetical protein [Methylobacterium indicum]KTS37490.1 hypothetical protein NS229_07170 [Methylobacterium indicum]KTS39071.1 hypothetical protein NS228_16300 [Methylobacterium indicum]KTS51398.1 hypothetical protein NS230_13685 [Methylobacterium indicum]
MPLRYERRITRAMVRSSPSTLWVFGDNLQHRGLGGQAREMRGEPNAVGLATKRAPRRTPDAYLTDEDLAEVRQAWVPAYRRLAAHLAAGGDVIWPVDGIGTGLADLPKRAPAVWSALERLRSALEAAGAATPTPASR